MIRSNQPHNKKARMDRLVVRLQNDIKKYSNNKEKLVLSEKHLENVLKKLSNGV